jgi:2-keto-3-deoxy-6-phosphogluconate aldolase
MVVGAGTVVEAEPVDEEVEAAVDVAVALDATSPFTQ